MKVIKLIEDEGFEVDLKDIQETKNPGDVLEKNYNNNSPKKECDNKKNEDTGSGCSD